ncbi:hypothetical protein [Anabaena sp. CCY 9910]|uniref:hypothetical protein n=1 Tax=Anabaena sp. CCY 9910 TaxID=3103870 RepID=UPI0039DFC0E8
MKSNLSPDDSNTDEIASLLGAIAPPTLTTKAYKSGKLAIRALSLKQDIQRHRPWAFAHARKRAQNAIDLIGEKPIEGLYGEQLQKSGLRSVEFSPLDEQGDEIGNTVIIGVTIED